jgi:hypothetical protein
MQNMKHPNGGSMMKTDILTLRAMPAAHWGVTFASNSDAINCGPMARPLPSLPPLGGSNRSASGCGSVPAMIAVHSAATNPKEGQMIAAAYPRLWNALEVPMTSGWVAGTAKRPADRPRRITQVAQIRSRHGPFALRDPVSKKRKILRSSSPIPTSAGSAGAPVCGSSAWAFATTPTAGPASRNSAAVPPAAAAAAVDTAAMVGASPLSEWRWSTAGVNSAASSAWTLHRIRMKRSIRPDAHPKALAHKNDRSQPSAAQCSFM